MQQSDIRPNRRSARLQLGIVAAALVLIHAWPSSDGSVLLVPLTPHARSSVARLAIDAGAKLVVRGPIAGSIVVRADRPRFSLEMMTAGVLPLATSIKGCGAAEEQAA